VKTTTASKAGAAQIYKSPQAIDDRGKMRLLNATRFLSKLKLDEWVLDFLTL